MTTGAVYSQFADKSALLVNAVEELTGLPAAGSRKAYGPLVLALAAEAAGDARAREALAGLLMRHEAAISTGRRGSARQRVALATAAGGLILQAAGLSLPEDWPDRSR